MGIFLAFFVVVSLVCLILLVKIKLKQRRSQVRAAVGCSLNAESWFLLLCLRTCLLLLEMPLGDLERTYLCGNVFIHGCRPLEKFGNVFKGDLH